MSRHPAFPNVPGNEPVGPMDGRRFMESYCDTTLQGIARGRAGEPRHVISMAKSILSTRQIEREGGTPEPDFPKSVKTPEERDTFTRMMFLAENGHPKDRQAAITILLCRFGYNWHREAPRS